MRKLFNDTPKTRVSNNSRWKIRNNVINDEKPNHVRKINDRNFLCCFKFQSLNNNVMVLKSEASWNGVIEVCHRTWLVLQKYWIKYITCKNYIMIFHWWKSCRVDSIRPALWCAIKSSGLIYIPKKNIEYVHILTPSPSTLCH